MPVAKKLKHSGGWLVALGILSIIAGVLAIALPGASGATFTWLIGAVLLGVGIVQIIGAFKAGSWGAGLADLLGGLLYAVAGIIALVNTWSAMAALALLIAIFFLVRGIYQVWASFQIKPEAGWGWLLFGGILALALGLMLLVQWPGTALWVIGLFVGIELIFSGWTYVFLGSGLRRMGGTLEDRADAIREKVNEAGRKLGEGADEPETQP